MGKLIEVKGLLYNEMFLSALIDQYNKTEQMRQRKIEINNELKKELANKGCKK